MRRDEERRAGELVTAMRAIVARADLQGRDLTDSEATEFDSMEIELRRLSPHTTVRETTSGRGEMIRIGEPGARSFGEWRSSKHGTAAQDEEEYRGAFWTWVTTPDLRGFDAEEYRALSKATGAAGAFLVPTDMAAAVVRAIRHMGPIAQLARTLVTDSGEVLNVPANTQHGSAAWVAENASFAPSDEVFAQVPLGAFKAGTKVIVSEELLQDSAFPLDSFLATEFGERIGQLEETAFVTGDGSGKPLGIAHASSGVTVVQAATGNATGFSYAALLELVFSVPPQYRTNAAWAVNDGEVKNLMALVDDQNRPLWNSNLAEGAPPSFLGYPVYTSPDLAAPAASAKSVVFGDIARAYTVRRVQGFGIQRQNELHSDSGQIGFRGFERVDGRVVLADAVRIGQHSAS